MWRKPREAGSVAEAIADTVEDAFVVEPTLATEAWPEVPRVDDDEVKETSGEDCALVAVALNVEL